MTSLYSDEYVLVKKDKPASTEVKQPLILKSDVKAKAPLLREVAPKFRVPEIGVWLTTTFTNTSAAATPQFPVFGIQPGQAAEFSSLAALYSEYKCTKVQILYHTHCADTTQTNTVQSIMTYDPTRNTALASIVAGLSATYHKLGVLTPTAAHVAPRAVNSSGFWKLSAQVPQSSINSVNEGTDMATGKWSDCLDTSVFYGFLRAGLSSASAGTTTIDGFARMYVLFRSRQ